MAPGHHDPQGSGYGNDSWLGLGGYSQPGPPSEPHTRGEYGYDFTTTPITMEPNYSMSRPPPYAASHPQMPPPLVMPHHNMWPSMLANSNGYQTPILPAAPVQTPMSASSHGSDMTPTSAKTTTSRRKLTDDERRLMCLEAENNPTMKQTQIGAKFNVERSTVSKILRQKDKYMKPQPKEEVTSPGKKTKVKLPDVEKTLVNWVRKQQLNRKPITNEELRKQISMFSAGRSDQPALTSTAWLEKFKQKYLSGNDSKIGYHDDTGDSSTTKSGTPADNSPISSSGLVSPPMSAVEETKIEKDLFDFDGRDYVNSPSFQHNFSGDFSHISDSVISPVSPELVRDDTASIHMGDNTPTDISFSRQRSQTLPHMINANDGSRPNSRGLNTPGLPVRSMTTNFESKSSSVDPRQTMKRHKSVPDIHDAEIVRFSSMQPPPIPRSSEISPISHPGSPVPQDETIRALHTIKKLLEQRPDVAEPDDYVMIGKLMEKMKLLRSPGNTPLISGGINTMDLADSPRISKKRTMVEMSS